MSTTFEELDAPRPSGSRSTSGQRRLPSAELHQPKSTDNRKFRIAVIVAVLAASVAGVLFSNQAAGQREAVLVVERPVTAGQLITTADLTERRMSVDPEVDVVTANRRSQIVGKVAATHLTPGAPLSSKHVQTGPLMGAGEVEVPLALKPGQFPPSLRAEDRVQVVRTVRNSGDGGQAVPGSQLLAATARVAQARSVSENSSDTVIALFVDQASAIGIAQAAAGGEVALIRVGQ